LSLPLEALRVGDLAGCVIPLETLVEIGLDLKKRGSFPRTMVIGVADGYNGYLPTPEQQAARAAPTRRLRDLARHV
jgi:neutral ceramidase